MEIVAQYNEDGSINATIEGVEYTGLPAEVVKSFDREPPTFEMQHIVEENVAVYNEAGQVERYETREYDQQVQVDGKVLETFRWTSGNRFRQMVADWEAKGGVIAPYVPPEPTLPALAPYQFRAMLDIAGLTDKVSAAIDKLPDPKQRAVAKAKLEYGTAFERDDPIIAQLAPIVGKSADEIDKLWLEASKL